MKRSSVLLCALASVIALVAIAALTPLVEGQTPKRGGILHSVLIEDPPGLLIHESATVSSEETDRLIDQQSLSWIETSASRSPQSSRRSSRPTWRDPCSAGVRSTSCSGRT